jgi:hypothetical protein
MARSDGSSPGSAGQVGAGLGAAKPVAVRHGMARPASPVAGGPAGCGMAWPAGRFRGASRLGKEGRGRAGMARSARLVGQSEFGHGLAGPAWQVRERWSGRGASGPAGLGAVGPGWLG